MKLARIRYRQRLLRERYGIIGVVAGRYLEAGFHVRLMHPTRHGPVHILALKGDRKFVIEVAATRRVDDEVLIKLVDKAKSLGGEPVLILYGKSPRVSGDLANKLRELGVRLRIVRG